METSKNDTPKTYEGLNINWSDEKIFDFLNSIFIDDLNSYCQNFENGDTKY